MVYGSEGLYAIEVKNSKHIHPQDLRSLKSFKEDYPQCKSFLLYRGEDRLLRDDILCVPCQEFLVNLRPGRQIGSGSL